MSGAKFPWVKTGAGWVAQITAEVTIYASPERTTGVLGEKAARGTKWRVGASTWDAGTRSISRYGRDTHHDHPANAQEAKILAESIYREATAAQTVTP